MAVLVSVTGAGVIVVVAAEVKTGSVMVDVSVVAGKVDVTTIVWAGAVKTDVNVAAA